MAGGETEGYPLIEALEIANKEAEELKTLLAKEGVEVEAIGAGSSGWGQPPYGFPTLGIHLKEERHEAEAVVAKIVQLTAPITERGVQVTVYPKQ